MHRLFVERTPAFSNEARHLLHELQESLDVPHLETLRLVQRYDVDGLNDAQFEDAIGGILSEPQIDLASRELRVAENEHPFVIEYLPGQFDQRADSAAQCIQILTGLERPRVASARVILPGGALEPDEISRIKNFLINTVDSHEVSLDAPSFQAMPSVPGDVVVLDGFCQADPVALRRELGLAMSSEDVAFCQNYFRDEEGRAPSITEIRMLDTYWSDHCRHTTFLTRIAEATFGEGTDPVRRAWENYLAVREKLGRQDRDVTLMDIALIGMRELRASGELDNLEESEEVNAASIIVTAEISKPDGSVQPEEWLIQFKNETHNHPTEIEPFGGAATCLGGCIRDPLSGRSYVYQAMRVTGAADPTVPISETLPGKLPQRKICQVAARGYSSYGNQIGLATGQVAEVYHPGYVAKRLEIGAVVAAAPRSNVFRGTPVPGDVILLIGGRTGRDGVGGATGSSKEHTDTALENSAEVQKGDAPTERKIQRLFRNPDLSRRIKICNDFGAGGVSVAIGEIAPSLDIDLDAVPKKYDGLDGTELAISESQERMAVCVDPADVDFFIAASDAENLECVLVAKVADHGRLRMTWRDKTIVDLSRAFLDTNGVQQSAIVHVPSPSAPPKPVEQSLVKRLAELPLASQKGLGEMFDGSVGASTVLWPFGGEHQLTPPDAMVAKIPLLEGDTDLASFMSWAYDPCLSSASPFHGAAWAVTESVLKLVSAGARLQDARLTLQEYFPKLGSDPARWGLPFAALLGAFDAQHGLRLAAIGGKDSMSGSFNELDVPPTLVSFALAPGGASLALSPEFKEPGTTVSLIEIPPTDDGLPDYDAIRSLATQLHGLHQSGGILSMKHVGTAGLGHAIAICCFGHHLGFKSASSWSATELATRRPAAFILEHADPLHASLGAQTLGVVTEEPIVDFGSEKHSLSDLLAAWTGKLESVYPTLPDEPSTGIVDPLTPSGLSRPQRTSDAVPQPRVVIPAFPGTNSEYDSAKAFAEAGAATHIEVFRNLSARHIDESIEELAKQIRSSEILFIPGGFSAGDEPDGSAKFIATVLRSPRVADAIMDLLRNRDGLILGICNGFQALIKTGLVPYGEIREPDVESPTLFHNDIGRHLSCYAWTRVVDHRSPWFALSKPGELHRIPLSHGEGKFVATNEVLASLIAQGQIATQYCDASGQPSMDITVNPNGSMAAIEGITSPCGRVLGKMGHSERRGTHVAKNIPGEKFQPIFEAGVRWFA
ncbi:phosphoribosylformylglycinamidine synthase [Haloferula luteola]|uniref:Phosphoribosylformylglycinamidine synthase n=1 Tax=Haloferula luteola TaxID=595692 RepID=A0A840UVT6_9BACT|nr:phosphoribosylformylglycinamidine synthase [Haloferula luteola]MBB5349835.1 phosphoribosylformylglycinamidine synthase [Haloferula luteola]